MSCTVAATRSTCIAAFKYDPIADGSLRLRSLQQRRALLIGYFGSPSKVPGIFDYACSVVGFDPDAVVDRVVKALLAAKIFLGRLDGDVAQKKLDLVRFPSGIAAQTGAGPTEVMRGEVFNGCSFGAVLYVPHDPLRYAASPGLACTANAPKHAAFAHTSGRKPRIDGAFDPVRNWHRPDMSALPDQINDSPVILAA